MTKTTTFAVGMTCEGACGDLRSGMGRVVYVCDRCKGGWRLGWAGVYVYAWVRPRINSYMCPWGLCGSGACVI